MPQTPILPIAYYGNIAYWLQVIQHKHIQFEHFEFFEKQSNRNSTSILSSHGLIKLSIPLAERGNKTLTKDIAIDYKTDWITQHQRSIVTCYQSAPYFEFYWNDYLQVYAQKPIYLHQLNTLLFNTLLRHLKLNEGITASPTTQFEVAFPNLRDKKQYNTVANQPNYYQVFTPEQGFTPNCSILDILFNKGPESYWYFEDYLKFEQNIKL
ncbi:MAG: WbqC family protein [Bacteroidia bacterium]